MAFVDAWMAGVALTVSWRTSVILPVGLKAFAFSGCVIARQAGRVLTVAEPSCPMDIWTVVNLTITTAVQRQRLVPVMVTVMRRTAIVSARQGGWAICVTL